MEALAAYDADDALKPLPSLINASHQLPERGVESGSELEHVQVSGVGLSACNFSDLFDAQASGGDIIKSEALVGHDGLHGLAESSVIGREGFGLPFRWHGPQHYLSPPSFVNRNMVYHGRRQSSEAQFTIFSMGETNPDQRELQRLGRSIRQIRNEKGLSVADLAQATNVDEATIEALEAGRLDPPYDLMLDVASGLGIEMSALIIQTEQADGGGDDR
jgi:DNA-binding XRE family transcriptional regulator